MIFVQYLLLYLLLGLIFQQTGKKGKCSRALGPWSAVEMIRSPLLCIAAPKPQAPASQREVPWPPNETGLLQGLAG